VRWNFLTPPKNFLQRAKRASVECLITYLQSQLQVCMYTRQSPWKLNISSFTLFCSCHWYLFCWPYSNT